MARNTLARLSGHPGSYKSFLALDWALHVAHGRRWHGSRVRKGEVAYCLAEGVEGFSARLEAWEVYHRVSAEHITFLPRPVQTVGPEWKAFVEVMLDIQPALIVLDTQARVTVGVNENDPTEFGAAIERWELLRRITGATVLLLHHMNAEGSRPRGNTAVAGGIHTELEITKSGTGDQRKVKLITEKQKDQAEHDPLELQVKVIEVAQPPAPDVTEAPVIPVAPITSVVLDRDLLGEIQGGDGDGIETGSAADQLHELMLAHFTEGRGGTKAEVKSLAVRTPTNPRGVMAKATFYRAWNRLQEEGRMGKVGKTESYRPLTQAEAGEVPG